MSHNSLKKIDLQSLNRPKTLIIIHYKNKRISIPLFDCPPNLTQFLFAQLNKFQATVLHKEKNEHQQRQNSFVCFSASKQEGNHVDLKMSILLSFIRLNAHNYLQKASTKRRRTDTCLDITKYYKFMEIQPFYVLKVNQMFPTYEICSVLDSTSSFTTYLSKRNSDGRFFSVKAYLADNQLGIKQYNVLKLFHEEQAQLNGLDEEQTIPEIEQLRKQGGFIILIFQYCPGGKASDYFRKSQKSPKNISEIQCLDYMKQLVWGVHTLHEKYNLIHRQICLENLQIDLYGNLRIINYQNCMSCYTSNYLINTQVAQIYEGYYQMPNKIAPPEVIRSGRYNNLVDYYGIGTILYQLLYGKPFNQKNKLKSEQQRSGIEVAIENLMSDNIQDRQLFVNQIISELHEEKIKKYKEGHLKYEGKHSSISHQTQASKYERDPLVLGKIYYGTPLSESKSGVIKSEIICKILGPQDKDKQFIILDPKNKEKSKSKKKNKSKEKLKSKSKDQKHKQVSVKKIAREKPQTYSNFDTRSKKSEKSNKSKDSRNNSNKSQKSKSSKSKKKNEDKPEIRTIESSFKPPLVHTIKSPIKLKQKNSSDTHMNIARKSPEKVLKNTLETFNTGILQVTSKNTRGRPIY